MLKKPLKITSPPSRPPLSQPQFTLTSQTPQNIRLRLEPMKRQSDQVTRSIKQLPPMQTLKDKQAASPQSSQAIRPRTRLFVRPTSCMALKVEDNQDSEPLRASKGDGLPKPYPVFVPPYQRQKNSPMPGTPATPPEPRMIVMPKKRNSSPIDTSPTEYKPQKRKLVSNQIMSMQKPSGKDLRAMYKKDASEHYSQQSIIDIGIAQPYK